MWKYYLKEGRKEGFTGGTSSKEPTCRYRRHERRRFSLWAVRSPGGERGMPLQCSCLENLLDRGAWGLQCSLSQESDTTKATPHACTHSACMHTLRMHAHTLHACTHFENVKKWKKTILIWPQEGAWSLRLKRGQYHKRKSGQLLTVWTFKFFVCFKILTFKIRSQMANCWLREEAGLASDVLDVWYCGICLVLGFWFLKPL